QWARELNAAQRELPEIALDLQGLLRSSLVAVARGASFIIGTTFAREGAAKFYQHTVPVDHGAHAVDRYLEVPRALGVQVTEEEIEFPLPQGRKPAGINVPEEFVLLHPFARGEGKSMAQDAIQALCDCLTPHPVVIVGRASEVPAITGAHVL